MRATAIRLRWPRRVRRFPEPLCIAHSGAPWEVEGLPLWLDLIFECDARLLHSRVLVGRTFAPAAALVFANQPGQHPLVENVEGILQANLGSTKNWAILGVGGVAVPPSMNFGSMKMPGPRRMTQTWVQCASSGARRNY